MQFTVPVMSNLSHNIMSESWLTDGNASHLLFQKDVNVPGDIKDKLLDKLLQVCYVA